MMKRVNAVFPDEIQCIFPQLIGLIGSAGVSVLSGGGWEGVGDYAIETTVGMSMRLM
jgi:hypothetical protein